MMVTFVSQCEKNALKKTRRVLDAFANRIGDNTWQTLITEDGLITVKKMLRQTASKSTAVSCHWIRSRARSQFLWVVGNRRKFNELGVVPVNYTESDMNEFKDSLQWKTLDIIACAASIAGLFHDFGKANILFQNKLLPKAQRKKDSKSYEPYRHEWISLRLFQAFVGKQTDQEWLYGLANINQTTSDECIKDGLIGGDFNHPISNLPPFAQLVVWLVLTHHKLPLSPNWLEGVDSAPLEYINDWFEGEYSEFNANWNSYNCNNPDLKHFISDNWTFSSSGLPYQSEAWRYNARVIALKSRSKVRYLVSEDFIFNQVFTTHVSRLCLMLADHYWSNDKRPKKDEWRAPNYEVFANTNRETGALKQQLDEHLIGVAFEAKKIALALPKFKNDLIPLTKNAFLESDIPKSSDELKKQFGWQDDAKKLALSLSESTSKNGFFGINMASTGKGKTLANAKIMYALGDKTGRRRFSVALGLRTLTLQTGREYRTQLDLNSENLAIAVGGSAVKQLFENAENTKAQKVDDVDTGSDSHKEYLDTDLYVDYQGKLNSHGLSKWTQENDRIEKLIQAPVLVCTIDHLIPATEGTRGGKQIGPMLRLLTSDLVIDEPDDFGLEDLPALCRLVHWAGMLGSRVLLSTATLPPSLAYAAFQAYKAGWEQFAKANLDSESDEITCAWFDEENAKREQVADFSSYKKTHEKFVNARIKHLKQNSAPKHLAEILPISKSNDKTAEQVVAQTVQSAAFMLHSHHNQEIANKTVSIGLVRMANINPLVAVAKELLKLDIEQADTRIHFCVYHSRFPLAVRSYLENKLDHFLKRNPKDGCWPPVEFNEQLGQFTEKNHIFIVLASPVAEVGRDHDYDWAIIEPSSMRSIIQIAGRVLRHRNIMPQQPNILLLDKNIKCLNGKDRCFDRPGFELEKLKLKMDEHELTYVLADVPYQKLDSTLRIVEDSQFNGKEAFNLVSLEHKALNKQLIESAGASVWWEVNPFWCGEVQKHQKFRDSPKDEAYHLFVNSSDELYWQRKNEAVIPYQWGVNNGVIAFEGDLEINDFKTFWFNLSAVNVYQSLADELNKNKENKMELKEVAEKFGEVRITEYKNSDYTYTYHELLGLFRELNNA